jgi:integrase
LKTERPVLGPHQSSEVLIRQIAERRQRDWVATLRIIDREVERTNFARLITSFLAANRENQRTRRPPPIRSSNGSATRGRSTEQQFHAIVESIRSQRFTDHADDSADFVEFLGLAGLGQAEASSLVWSDIDWARGCLHVRRCKTAESFDVPIYPDLLPLLEKLKAKAGRVLPNRRVLAIKNAKKALARHVSVWNIPDSRNAHCANS